MDSREQSPQIFNNLLFPKIFQAFRMSIQPSKLIIASLALATIFLAGWVMDFTKTVTATPGTQGKITELNVYMANPDEVQSYIEKHHEQDGRAGVFFTLWKYGSSRFHEALNHLFAFDLPGVAVNIAEYFRAVGWALRYHTLYCIFFFVIELAVISVAGGAICRIAALQFARGEKPGLTEALKFSTRKFTSFFTVPLAPIIIIIFIGLCIFLVGLIGNIPRIGELIVGISMPLSLAAGALITVVTIGAVAGFNLMFPAVAYDGSDCFDAISRSFSYVYARPWRMGFYTTIATIYGAICYIFVRFFAFLLFRVTHWFLQFGIWTNSSSGKVDKLTAIWTKPTFMNLLDWPTASNWSESAAAFLVYLSLLVVVGLVVSFVTSFYFSANTIIYAALRNKVDDTPLEDIYTYSSDVKTELTAAESESEEPQDQPDSET